MKPPRPIKLADPTAELANRDLRERIVELQNRPSAATTVLPDVQLADGVATPIAHGLGREPKFVHPSAPRNASSSGRIEEVRSSTYDRKQVVVLKATGWGATITVDVAVM